MPGSFSLAELKALPARTQITRHDCVEGWSAIGKWQGPQLGQILALAQREATGGAAQSPRDLHGLGTVALVSADESLPDGGRRVELDGLRRGRVVSLIGIDTLIAEVELLDDQRIGRVRGAKDNSYTLGVICEKVKPASMSVSDCVAQIVSLNNLGSDNSTINIGQVLRVPGKELGLGVVNPRTANVEARADLVAAVHRALELYAPHELFLNPDCGFGTFSNRPVNEPDVALRKLAAMVDAARELRAEYADAPSGRSTRRGQEGLLPDGSKGVLDLRGTQTDLRRRLDVPRRWRG